MSSDDPRWLGPPAPTRTEAPCARCGRPTTRHVITAIRLTPRQGAFTGEQVPECRLCWVDGVLGKLGEDPRRFVWARYRRLLERTESAPLPPAA